MTDDKNQIQVGETEDQLRGDHKHLQKLWEGHRKTQILIQRSLAAIEESEVLLGEIDGKYA
jgi:hypothetical protein